MAARTYVNSPSTIQLGLMDLMVYYGFDPDNISIEAKKFLAQALSEQAGRGDKPWSYNYIHGVLFNQTEPGREFQEAVYALAAQMDGMKAEYTQAKKMTVYVVGGDMRPGALMIGFTTKLCALPGCGVWFVAKTARSMYHSEQCRREADKLRKAARRQNASL